MFVGTRISQWYSEQILYRLYLVSKIAKGIVIAVIKLIIFSDSAISLSDSSSRNLCDPVKKSIFADA